MNCSDKERLKKIIVLWNTLKSEIEKRGVTRDSLLEDQFLQWAVTTPIYNIGEQVYQLTPDFKKDHPEVIGA